jgi:hypothetical protein
MLELPPAVLIAALERSWGMTVESIAYRPVGWGSHHWEAADTSGLRWFITADELANKKLSESEPLTLAYGRLRASLAAAIALQDAGHEFVVAPVPAKDGEPLIRVNDAYGQGARFTVARNRLLCQQRMGDRRGSNAYPPGPQPGALPD